MKHVMTLGILLVLLLNESLQISAKSFVDTIASSVTKVGEMIDSYLHPNDANEVNEKELEKRKQLYDKFSSTVYEEHSMVTRLKGILDEKFEPFSKRFLRIFPEDKQADILEYLKTVRNAEDNDWKFLNIMYKNDKTNTIQILSLYGNHVGQKSNIYFIDYRSNFEMPTSDEKNGEKVEGDLFAISSASAFKEEMEEIKLLPKGMNPTDVRMLLNIVKKKAMKEFEKQIEPTASPTTSVKDEM